MKSVRTRSIAALLAVAGVTAAGTGAVIAGADRTSPEAHRCGADRNAVVAEFSIDAARDLWDYLPAMLRAPELEQDDRSAHVVIFAGEFDPSDVPMVPTGQASQLNEVVCVIQADGTLNLYSSVSRANSKWEQR